jgi:hypothetical protein
MRHAIDESCEPTKPVWFPHQCSHHLQTGQQHTVLAALCRHLMKERRPETRHLADGRAVLKLTFNAHSYSWVVQPPPVGSYSTKTCTCWPSETELSDPDRWKGLSIYSTASPVSTHLAGVRQHSRQKRCLTLGTGFSVSCAWDQKSVRLEARAWLGKPARPR